MKYQTKLVLRSLVVLLLAVPIGCGKSEDDKPRGRILEVTTSYLAPRNLVAAGYRLPIEGSTRESGTIDVSFNDVSVAQFQVAGGAFAYELENFGTGTGAKTMTVTMVGTNQSQTVDLVDDAVKVETAGIAYLTAYGRKDEANLFRRWSAPLKIRNELPELEEKLTAAVDHINAWGSGGGNASWPAITIDPNGTMTLKDYAEVNAYQVTVGLNSRGTGTGTLEVGASVASEQLLTKILLNGLGMKGVAAGDTTYTGTLVDTAVRGSQSFYPFLQSALRILYSYPVGVDGFLPPSTLGARVVNAPATPLNLVTDGTVLELAIDTRKADKVEVLVDDAVVETRDNLAGAGGIQKVLLKAFGTAGKKDIKIRATGGTASVEALAAIDHDEAKVEELALEFLASNLRFSDDKKSIRWPATTLTVRNGYPAVTQALNDAIAFLGERLDVKFTVVGADATTFDIDLVEDTQIDDYSKGGQTVQGFAMREGIVKIEPDHADSFAIVAHELCHVLGVQHVNDTDANNNNSLITQLLTRGVLYPHQQLAINLQYRFPGGTPIANVK